MKAKLRTKNSPTLTLPDSVLARMQNEHPDVSAIDLCWIGLEVLLGQEIERPAKNKFKAGQDNPRHKK